MTWSMPRSVLKVVAGFIALTAVGSFAMGIITAPQRGRLPGERASLGGAGTPIQATEATPLSQERIEGPPPAPELTPEEKAQLEADRKAKAEADAAARLAAADTAAANAAAAPSVVTPVVPAPDRVGELLEKQAPPPEEPPF
jgi:hypothetical protein